MTEELVPAMYVQKYITELHARGCNVVSVDRDYNTYGYMIRYQDPRRPEPIPDPPMPQPEKQSKPNKLLLLLED